MLIKLHKLRPLYRPLTAVYIRCGETALPPCVHVRTSIIYEPRSLFSASGGVAAKATTASWFLRERDLQQMSSSITCSVWGQGDDEQMKGKEEDEEGQWGQIQGTSKAGSAQKEHTAAYNIKSHTRPLV